ncbi:MAG: NHL repeat-containing protein [Solirubrobacteraceae bacterium]
MPRSRFLSKMDPVSMTRWTRPTMRAGRVQAALLVFLVLASLWALVLAPGAFAAIPFCPPGAGAGQCNSPQGVATDWETGHVYVADRGNNRVNVFESGGAFVSSFAASTPTWVAVDNDEASASRHDVYVASNDFEVQKFKPSGELVDSFGKEGEGPCELTSTDDPIAVGPGGDVYVADSYDKDGSGPEEVFVSRVNIFDPSGACVEEVPLFESKGTIRNIVVNSAGDMYVTVAGEGGVIRRYSPTGVLLTEMGGVETEGMASDPAGNVFGKQRGVTVAKTPPHSTYFIAEYAPDTTLIKRFAYNAGSDVPGLAAYEGGGVEGVFATKGSVGVNFFDVPEGPVIVPEPCHVESGGIGSVRATLQAEVNPEGKETKFHFEYSDGTETKEGPSVTLPGSADFELHEAAQTIVGLKPETVYHCKAIAENADGVAPAGQEGSFETKEGFEFGPGTVSMVGEEEATVSAEGNPLGLEATAEIEYVEDAKFKVSRFAEALSVPTPELDYGASETVQLRSAVLTGLTPETVYHWRLHVRNDVPPAGLVCPRNGAEPCPANEHSFRTVGPFETPDNRAWELVSPSEKNSAEVGTPKIASGTFEDRNVRIQASAGSGEAATYTSFTSFGKDAEGAPSSSQYLSKRTVGGWVTEDLSPFGFQEPVIAIPFKGFSPELGFAAFKVSDGVLAPGCPAGVENLYLLNSASGARTCLTPEVPQGIGGCLVYAGANDDGSRVFFAAVARYAGVPEGEGLNLYEWSAAEGLKAIGILAGQSKPTAPTEGTAFGRSLDLHSVTNCQWGQTVMRHVVSADGSRAFWTYLPTVTVTAGTPGVQTVVVGGKGIGEFRLGFEGNSTPLLVSSASAGEVQKVLEGLSSIGAGNVEVLGSNPYTVTFKGALSGTTSQIEGKVSSELFAHVHGAETVQLDNLPSKGAEKEKPGAGPADNGVFVAASKDGSVVYFTDTGKLISGSKAEAGKPDLYRYELGKTEPLSDLTKSTTPANVQGGIGASDDGSYVYFVAKSVLSTGENAGEKAKEGAYNLYLFHGKETRFIAQLSPEDGGDWSSQPKSLTARVTPDGKHLAFLSVESQALAGYDNTVAKGQHCEFQHEEILQGGGAFYGGPLCTQGFVYDAEARTLSCASCNPSGARPLGPTLLPGWSNVYEGPRYLSDDGSRFFFESFDAILRADENGRRDVYEFERPGAGSCTTKSGAFDPVSGGCHFLVSSGKSSDESYLIDASSNGRDVFFSTRQALVGWDTNPNYDIYDYREGGGFAEPSQAVACQGEGCLPNALVAPSLTSPATSVFAGPANPIFTAAVTPKSIGCPKGKHRELKKGKEICAKNPIHKKQKKKPKSKKKPSSKRKPNSKKGAKR